MEMLAYTASMFRLKDCLINMDPAFFSQIDTIFNKIVDEIVPQYFSEGESKDRDIFLKNLFGSAGQISGNEAIEIATEFFNSLSPQHGQLFQTLIHQNDFYFEQMDTVENFYSDSEKIKLTGTYFDVIQIVHETVHRFSNNISNSFVNGVLSEVDAIAYEIKANEFLKERYGIALDLNKFRMREIYDFVNNPFDIIIAFRTYLKLIEEKRSDYYSFLSYLKTLPIEDQQKIEKYSLDKYYLLVTDVPLIYAHSVAYILACYLLKENNFDAIEKITNCLSALDELEPEIIAYLEKYDIPIFKDGKVSLQGENYEKMLNAVPEYLASDIERSDTSR